MRGPPPFNSLRNDFPCFPFLKVFGWNPRPAKSPSQVGTGQVSSSASLWKPMDSPVPPLRRSSALSRGLSASVRATGYQGISSVVHRVLRGPTAPELRNRADMILGSLI